MTSSGPSGITRPRRSWAKIIVAAIILAVVAGAAGWLTPQLVARYTKPSYLGQDASALAKSLNCDQYKQASKHDESVYRYRDQGTCVLDGVVVTVTTFDKVSDGDAFASVMRAVIPVLHPTWVGASYAAGDGWNVADARNLTAHVAELAVRRLGAGAVYTIPSAKRS
ncbi:MAG: hypothetical protein AUI14_12795 [Actinobacteria bacterium 13_2_20CM_2_71_6]|nr:MAG: hypothetical protein AUI14_12795 [Actinobacteria bacterium 13_2_20CM_2_71_6]